MAKTELKKKYHLPDEIFTNLEYTIKPKSTFGRGGYTKMYSVVQALNVAKTANKQVK